MNDQSESSTPERAFTGVLAVFELFCVNGYYNVPAEDGHYVYAFYRFGS